MMMRRSFALAAFSFSACGPDVEAAAVTPVQKVVELLGKLEAKLEAEGKEEAAAYDKYACFCKEEVDDKQYAIEKSVKKIKALDAEIERLGAVIAALDGEISGLGQESARLTGDMKDAKAIRVSEHAAFLVEQADVDGAISACERAIQALKESKSQMGGKTELEAAALAQVQAVARVVLGGSARSALAAGDLSQLDGLAAASQPGKAYESTYHSNDIIATIEALSNKFTDRKNLLEQDEFDTNSAFERRQLDLANQKKFAEQDKLEKETLAEKKREEKSAAEDDRTQEASEKNADQNFMRVLVADCEEKARLWDQRSQTRADELRAMSEAQGALKEGVAPNWKANKKLVGLQKSKAASFLQLRGTAKGSLSRRVSQLLARAAEDLHSPVLSAAAIKVSAAEDHFVKVRQIIKDLVAQLEREAQEEQTQKAFCDQEMKEAVQQRDAEQGKVEDNKAQISKKQADKARLAQEIATLSKEIAANKKALMEASELREAESVENARTVSEAKAGKEAVDNALQVLKNFYEGAAFVQFVPTDSDRQGKTVADKAPEVFDSEYKGAQEASKGILGLLEVILSDFGRTVTTVTEEEAEAQTAFDSFKDTNEADTQLKESAVERKQGQIADIEDDLVTLTDALGDAAKSHGLALVELEKLHTMCVAGEETYEERVAKRQKEIEALKEAHDILENWQQ